MKFVKTEKLKKIAKAVADIQKHLGPLKERIQGDIQT